LLERVVAAEGLCLECRGAASATRTVVDLRRGGYALLPAKIRLHISFHEGLEIALAGEGDRSGGRVIFGEQSMIPES